MANESRNLRARTLAKPLIVREAKGTKFCSSHRPRRSARHCLLEQCQKAVTGCMRAVQQVVTGELCKQKESCTHLLTTFFQWIINDDRLSSVSTLTRERDARDSLPVGVSLSSSKACTQCQARDISTHLVCMSTCLAGDNDSNEEPIRHLWLQCANLARRTARQDQSHRWHWLGKLRVTVHYSSLEVTSGACSPRARLNASSGFLGLGNGAAK